MTEIGNNDKNDFKWSRETEPINKLVSLLSMGDGRWPVIILPSIADLPIICPLCSGEVHTDYTKGKEHPHNKIYSIPGIDRAWCREEQCNEEEERNGTYKSPTYVFPVNIEGELLMAEALKRIQEKKNG